jgi:F-type H+-transporting ATPase subunit b
MFLLASLPETHNGAWLSHDKNEIIWGSIAFALVMVLLIWKAGPAIKKAMTGRTDRIQSEMDAAEVLRTDAEAERDRIRAALADSDSEAARIVEEGRQTADQLKVELAKRTEAAIVALRERGAADLDAARRQAESDLREEVARLALGAAEHVVHANLDDATQQGLIEGYIARVGAAN